MVGVTYSERTEESMGPVEHTRDRRVCSALFPRRLRGSVQVGVQRHATVVAQFGRRFAEVLGQERALCRLGRSRGARLVCGRWDRDWGKCDND